MEVYNPQKYCMSCKNPFSRFEPNPKFLSCRHLMCDRCFKSNVKGLKVKCPCGNESFLPIPEHRVFPDLGLWDTWMPITRPKPAFSSRSETSSPWSNVLSDTRKNMQRLSVTPPRSVKSPNILGDIATNSYVNNYISDWEEPTPVKTNHKPVKSPNILEDMATNSYVNHYISDWEEPTPVKTNPKPIQRPRPRVAANFSAFEKAIHDERTNTDSVRTPTPSSVQTITPTNQVQNTDIMPIWSQLNDNNLFESVYSGSEPEWMTYTKPSDFGHCAHHNLELELHCDSCGRYMCAVCVLSADHPPSHIVTIRPNAVFYSTRFPDTIRVLNEHGEAIEAFAMMVNHIESLNRPNLLNFSKGFMGAMEFNRDCMREYERRCVERATSNTVNSIAFEASQDRSLKEIDEYIAIKTSLENMLLDEEIKKPGSGHNLLLKLTSLTIFQIFKSSLFPGASRVMKEIPKIDAATNTHTAADEPYDVWLGTVYQRAQLAKKLTDPTAIIPPGWFINSLPNVFFIEFSVGQLTIGQVLIETNPDVAPVMSANFALLCDKSRSLSYQDCVVFQCWPRQSIITGDTETKNGTGGKSVLNDDFVVPDNSGLTSFRGAVGMRRLKKRISKACEISSQFRIMLYENKGITGIFGRVVKGIEVVEEISKYGDSNGNPKKVIRISDCGKI